MYYTANQFCKVLGFRLYPPTLSFWANYYMAKYDIYARANPADFPIFKDEEYVSEKKNLALFKSEHVEDY